MAANDLGPKSKKGALAPDGTPEIAYATSNLNAFLVETQAVKPPQADQPITPNQAVYLRLVINHAIDGKPEPGAVAWLDLNGNTAGGATPICINIGEVTFTVSVADWRPIFQADALAHLEQADEVYQACVPLDDARACVQDMRPGRTILTDGRAQALELISAADKAMTAGARVLLDCISDPESWVNPIPETATITGSWYAVQTKRGRK